MKVVWVSMLGSQRGISQWVVLLVSLIGGSLGGWDHGLQFLSVMMVTDYVLGVLVAVKLKRLDSSIMFWGVIRKVVMFVVVAVAFQAQSLLPASLPLRELTLWFYIGKEGLSFIEHTGKIIPLPVVLSQFFEQLKTEEPRKGLERKELDEDE
ncbi:phage holin family protein [Vagococcus salmoninarum]|uniref:phage holin family protein n=1 Tax=Vagococcus salmoninarum TaxID=2739 RepID=UPI00187F1CCB|nr:phage holin family protein [Vagococcus salmoninarum]MBE9390249.1 phage holin family protein [Vagococcus salmoninarum]